jgi:hypothetical protein
VRRMKEQSTQSRTQRNMSAGAPRPRSARFAGTFNAVGHHGRAKGSHRRVVMMPFAPTASDREAPVLESADVSSGAPGVQIPAPAGPFGVSEPAVQPGSRAGGGAWNPTMEWVHERPYIVTPVRQLTRGGPVGSR